MDLELLLLFKGKKGNIVSKTIVFSQPKIVKNEKFVSIDILKANSSYWEKDKPLLPVINKVFEFEFGIMIDSVEVTFSDLITRKLSKLVEPAPELLPLYSILELNIESSDEVLYEGIGVVSYGTSETERVFGCMVEHTHD